jgi:Trypsin
MRLAAPLRAFAFAGSAVAATAAQAVIGGTEDQGPLSRASVMVLSSKGGVCSGIVVAADVVLTAAHCVTGAPEHRVHYRDGGAPVLIAPAAKAIHPGYDANSIERRRRSIDLALLRLPEALPPRFETATLSAASAAHGAHIVIGGYGVSRERDHRSTGTFRTTQLPVVEPYGPSRILVWASGSHAGGNGACDGDSGGPITLAGSTAVLAVATWARGGGKRDCGQYSQGVLLGPQRLWIDGTLAGWGRQAQWR